MSSTHQESKKLSASVANHKHILLDFTWVDRCYLIHWLILNHGQRTLTMFLGVVALRVVLITECDNSHKHWIKVIQPQLFCLFNPFSILLHVACLGVSSDEDSRTGMENILTMLLVFSLLCKLSNSSLPCLLYLQLKCLIVVFYPHS